MQVFWAKGYQASSLHDLIGAMGISKSSFYETFGSKHELLLAAIGRYTETVTESVVARLEGGDSARRSIAGVFDHFLDSAVASDERRGCFLCNSAIELSPHDPQAAERVGAGLARLESAFHRAVVRGQDAGEIPADRDARALARYLTSSLNGFLVMAKANPDRAALEDIMRIVLAPLG